MSEKNPEVKPAGQPDEVDEVDVEHFAKEKPGDEKPRAKRYRIRIDREVRVVNVPAMTGREILALVNMTPQSHKLYELERGRPPRPVGPDEVVKFTRPGVERFQTIPLDPTEGGHAS